MSNRNCPKDCGACAEYHALAEKMKGRREWGYVCGEIEEDIHTDYYKVPEPQGLSAGEKALDRAWEINRC